MALKDISDNLLNKGEHTKEQVKPAELSSMEAEFAEITTKLEQERQTREGLGRLMKHPVEVITERPKISFSSVSRSPCYSLSSGPLT